MSKSRRGDHKKHLLRSIIAWRNSKYITMEWHINTDIIFSDIAARYSTITELYCVQAQTQKKNKFSTDRSPFHICLLISSSNYAKHTLPSHKLEGPLLTSEAKNKTLTVWYGKKRFLFISRRRIETLKRPVRT